jgi:hypothetical protein
MEFTGMPVTLLPFIADVSSKCRSVALSTVEGALPTLRELSAIRNLTRLVIGKNTLPFHQPGIVDAVLSFDALEYLDVHGGDRESWSDDQLEMLVGGQKLKDVFVDGDPGIRGSFFRACGSTVTTIHLTRCRNVDIQCLEHMKQLELLTSLNLSGCIQVDDTWAAAIGGMMNLVLVSLQGCHNVTDDGVVSIAGLPNLQDLDLSHMLQITSTSLETLSAHARLQRLNVEGAAVVSPADAMHIVSNRNAEMPALRLTVSEQVYAAFNQNELAAMEAARVTLVSNPLWSSDEDGDE